MRSELLIVSKEAILVAISCLCRMQITKRRISETDAFQTKQAQPWSRGNSMLYYCEKVPS